MNQNELALSSEIIYYNILKCWDLNVACKKICLE